MLHGAVIVAVAFWVFVAVTAVAGIVGEYQKRKLELEPLRAAIERGQPLDAALLEQLRSHRVAPAVGDALNPLQLRVGGIITIAGGVGIALLAPFLHRLVPLAVLPVIGGGLLVVCIGVGLLIAARVSAGGTTAQ